MPVTLIKTLLQEKLGLDVNSIGQASLDRAMHKRMRAVGLTNEDVYLRRLKSSAPELNNLIDEVVVPETWFFRDTKPFEALTKHSLLKLNTGKSYKIRLLSAPCSTGEEAYSMAIALLEAGMTADQFKILAMDVSKRSIAHAIKAEFRKNSFREKDICIREKYFQKIDENRFSLNSSIRDKVCFYNGNLLDSIFMERLGIFDILFCRNVMIYLDSKSRSQALASLERQLAPDGLLFVGHSESGFLSNARFRPAPYYKAFAFRKINSVEPDRSSALPDSDIHTNGSPDSNSQKSSYTSILARSYRYSTTTKAAPRIENKPRLDLKEARRLADEGRHDEAAELCKKYLNTLGPSSDAYFLLGMIHDEKGNAEEAARQLRKAVYLEPNHEEALLLLALLAERAGDLDRARIFKERIKRVQKQQRAT